MIDDLAFDELIRRVRAGDDEAAAELVRRYEPELRREVRIWLTDPALCRVLDSMDICQSVFGNFFARAALGQFELDDPNEVFRLLATMAQNRLTDLARRQRAQRRDVRREISLDAAAARGVEPATRDPSPSRIIAGRELLAQVRARLTPDERRLADARAAGAEWSEIARESGESAESLRKRLARALDRITDELDL